MRWYTGLVSLAFVSFGACAVKEVNGPPPAPTTAPTTATAAPTDTTTAATTAPTTTTAPTATTAPTTAPTFVFVEVPEPTTAAVSIQYSVADGRPKGLKDGASEAVWIWHEEKGKFWHVRTTTKKYLHRFSGAVVGEGGPITEIKPTRLEWGDRIKASPKGIVFDFETDGHEDGFDFRVGGNHCVRFYIKVDGKEEPGKINVGKTDAHPPAWHFKLCP
jgi:hypothetical protein